MRFNSSTCFRHLFFTFFPPFRWIIFFAFCCPSRYHSLRRRRRQFVLTLPLSLSSSRFLMSFLTNFASYPSLQLHKVNDSRIHFNVISLPYDIQRSQFVCIYYYWYFVLIFFFFHFLLFSFFHCLFTHSNNSLYFKATSKNKNKNQNGKYCSRKYARNGSELHWQKLLRLNESSGSKA